MFGLRRHNDSCNDRESKNVLVAWFSGVFVSKYTLSL